jgi:hypothetical protein
VIVPDVPDFKFLRWLHPHNNVAQRCLEIRRRRVDASGVDASSGGDDGGSSSRGANGVDLSRVISIVFIKLSGINVVSIDDSNNVVRFSGADVSKQ